MSKQATGEYSLFHYHNISQYLDASAGWELRFPGINNRSKRNMMQENQINNYKDNLQTERTMIIIKINNNNNNKDILI